MLAHGIRAAVVHVIALQIAAAANLYQRHRRHIAGFDQGAAVVGDLHPAAQLARAKGVIVEVGEVGQTIALVEVRADGVVVAQVREKVMLARAARPTLHLPVPEGIGVAAKDGEDLAAGRHLRRAPTGHGVQGHIEANLARHIEQGLDVPGVVEQLVLDLNADDRATVFPQQPLHLPVDLSVKAPDVFEIARGIFADVTAALRQQPVGEAAVAAFAVRPRPNAGVGEEAHLFAQLDKVPQIQRPTPVELPLHLLMVNPKDIRGGNGDAARLHLPQRFFPPRARVAGEMKLAHDGQPGAAIQREEMRIDGNRAALRIRSAHG